MEEVVCNDKKVTRLFPMLQTREAILKEINNNEKMWSTFYSWEEERQEEFLDFALERGE